MGKTFLNVGLTGDIQLEPLLEKKTKSMQVRASQLEPRDITTESSQLEPII